jgi:hypothetical protein
MRLLTLSNEEIVDLLDNMEKQSKAYKDDAIRICWYMRGSISYEDAMMLARVDKELIGKLIKENLETTQKTKMPFF